MTYFESEKRKYGSVVFDGIEYALADRLEFCKKNDGRHAYFAGAVSRDNKSIVAEFTIAPTGFTVS